MSWLGANTKQQGGASTPAVTGWQRPTDWLPMPVDAPNKIAILAMVRETTGEYAALKIVCDGGYTVDWGDGVIDNVASGIVAEHQYLYADTNLDGTLCTRGYKQAMIVITPQSTGDITEIYLNIRHSYYTVTGVSTPFLDVQINAPSCTVLQSYHANSSCRYIERWNITAVGSITNMSYMFQNNYSVQQYTFPASFGSVATNMYQMFARNYAVQQYTFPASFGSVATNMYQMFSGNYSVQQYTFPASFGSVATNMYQMFYNNYSVQQYTFPASFGSVATDMSQMFAHNYAVQQYTFSASFGSVATDMYQMFYNNYSVQQYTFPASFGSVATNMTSMFQNNYAVQQYTFPASFGSVATNMSYMFQNNYAVQQYTFPASFGSVATNMYYMFSGNYAVQQYTFPASFGSVATNMTSMFSGNSSAKTITNLEAAVSVTLTGLLETPAIIAVFNSLPIVTGQTITLTGLPGLAALTAADRLIATDKGWTVTP